jgi:signal transduction histidine kinase
MGCVHYRWLFCILYCLAALPSTSQVQTDGSKTYALNGAVYYYSEKDTSLSGEQALYLFQRGVFHQLTTPGNNVNFGYTEQVHWLTFSVNISDSAEHLEVGVANTGLYRLDHYQFSVKGELLFSHGPTGKRYPYRSRYIDNRHYYFPLRNTPQTIIVLFRLDLRGFDFYAPLRLVTQKYREESEERQFIVYTFIEGLLACILLFGVIAIVATRRLVFVYYFLYTLSYGLLIFAYSDWDFPYLYPALPQWAVIATSMYGIMTVLFMPCFSIVYLEIRKSRPVLYKVCKIVLAGIILLMICITLFYTTDGRHGGRRFVFILGSICINAGWLVQFYMVIIRMYDRFRPAYVYAAANMPSIISIVYFVLHTLGIVKYDDMVLLILSAALGIEILVMCVALIYQLNKYPLRHAQLTASLYRQEADFKEQLIITQETERKRIAEDLHDELGSSLAALKLRLQKTIPVGEELRLMLSIIDKASSDTRNISHNLMPPEFAETDLCLLLSNFYNRLSSEGEIKFHFHHSGTNHRFTKNEELLLYRIVMEITNNILKHSNASEATIQFIYYDDYLEVMAEDNGKGITEQEGSGIGMKNINSRINYLGGEMKIDTGIYGTTIIIRIPYKMKTEND